MPNPQRTRQESRKLMLHLRRDAYKIARHFGLKLRDLKAERMGVNGHYGICYNDGQIRIRLRHALSGKPLRYSSLINTLCHELAHLRHFNHGPGFKDLYFRILDYAREQKIYCPKPQEKKKDEPKPPMAHKPSTTVPEQLSLFG
jgi:predicted metal-dependent hydrolase